jgi:hypothetical protein
MCQAVSCQAVSLLVVDFNSWEGVGSSKRAQNAKATRCACRDLYHHTHHLPPHQQQGCPCATRYTCHTAACHTAACHTRPPPCMPHSPPPLHATLAPPPCMPHSPPPLHATLAPPPCMLRGAGSEQRPVVLDHSRASSVLETRQSLAPPWRVSLKPLLMLQR